MRALRFSVFKLSLFSLPSTSTYTNHVFIHQTHAAQKKHNKQVTYFVVQHPWFITLLTLRKAYCIVIPRKKSSAQTRQRFASEHHMKFGKNSVCSKHVSPVHIAEDEIRTSYRYCGISTGYRVPMCFLWSVLRPDAHNRAKSFAHRSHIKIMTDQWNASFDQLLWVFQQHCPILLEFGSWLLWARLAQRDVMDRGRDTAEPDGRQRPLADLHNKRSRKRSADSPGAWQRISVGCAGGRAGALYVSMHDTLNSVSSACSCLTWFRKMAKNFAQSLELAETSTDLIVHCLNVILRSIATVTYSGWCRLVLLFIPCAWSI